jgi:hypothetical protein
MTGDMASIDNNGQVRILGRYKDIIIRGGANIAPAGIERTLNIPGVEVSQWPLGHRRLETNKRPPVSSNRHPR